MGKILFLAQGERIKEYAERLQNSLPDGGNMEICVQYMDSAVDYVRKLDQGRYDVMIARGDTARVLKQADFPFPIVDIEISDEDVVRCIIRAGEEAGVDHPFIGIVSRADFAEKVKSFSDILLPRIELYTVDDEKNIESALKRARSDGVNVVVGGELVCRMAKQLNICSVWLESSYDLVVSAYERALEIQKSLLSERKKEEEIHIIFDTVTEGIVSINEKGMVQTMNYRAQVILGQKKGTGALTAIQLFGEKEKVIRQAVESGRKKSGVLIDIHGKNYAMDIIPILVEGTGRGSVVTLSSVHDIQKTEAKLRKGIYLKGNTAEYTFGAIKGKSKSIQEAIRLAQAFAPLQSNVLIIGQTGTGKELFAQGIHNASKRRSGPFVAVNCGSIPDNLIESELFGYVDGAFTGAKKGGKIGLFELAHNGTIFLDEISEMSLQGQVRLLRVIQEQQIRRVGSDAVIPVDVRIIAACNVDLRRMVAEQQFRKDLYYRLCVLVLPLPELNRRQGDVSLLADSFIGEYNQIFDKNVSLSDEAKELMEGMEWDGNIRQLKNFCERLCAVCPDGEVDAELVYRSYQSSYMFEQQGKAEIAGAKEPQKRENKVPCEQIEALMKKYNGNKSRVARELQISRTTLWKYLKR